MILILLFILIIGYGIGIHSMGVAEGIIFGSIFTIFMCSIVYFTLLYVKKSTPEKMLRFLQILSISGIALTTIGTVMALVLKNK